MSIFKVHHFLITYCIKNSGHKILKIYCFRKEDVSLESRT